MRSSALFLLAGCAVCFGAWSARADTVVLTNGHELAAKVLGEDSTSYLLEVEYGTLRLAKDKVKRIEPDTPQELAAREAQAQTHAATPAAPRAAAPSVAAATPPAKAAKPSQAKSAASKNKSGRGPSASRGNQGAQDTQGSNVSCSSAHCIQAFRSSSLILWI